MRKINKPHRMRFAGIKMLKKGKSMIKKKMIIKQTKDAKTNSPILRNYN